MEKAEAERMQATKKNRGALFTKRMKKTHTILLPQMLEYHSVFLKAAFEGSGYHFEVMDGSGGLKDKALKYISNDYCYPTVLIIGQVLEVLEGGVYPPDRIAFMEPQAGGACRAGNIYNIIIRTLEKCGQSQVPVISLNFRGLESHPGFRITPRLLMAAIAAVCYGDLVMALYHQVKPYEREAGAADKVREAVEAELTSQIRNHHGLSGKKRRENYRFILERFASVAVQKAPKKKVGVTGEIYMKFSSLGNHHLEKFLDSQSCECVMGGFVNYAIYVMDSERRIDGITNASMAEQKACDFVLSYLQKIQNELYAEASAYGRFQMDMPFGKMKQAAEKVIGESCITGDGWLIAAEVMDAVEKGCRHVLILHPFGCLVSHVCERGILKKLAELYPDVNIQTVEYDYDSSKALLESRVLLGLGDF